eukprot:366214-Chlamydomonas_euryale.AAC.2
MLLHRRADAPKRTRLAHRHARADTTMRDLHTRLNAPPAAGQEGLFRDQQLDEGKGAGHAQAQGHATGGLLRGGGWGAGAGGSLRRNIGFPSASSKQPTGMQQTPPCASNKQPLATQ